MYTVRIDDDFDLAKIARSGQCFRASALEGVAVDSGVIKSSRDARATTDESVAKTYRFIAGDKVLYLRRMCATDKFGAGEYEVSCSADEWRDFWWHYFDLGRNYREIRKSATNKNAFVDKAIAFSAGLRVLNQDPWETLVTFIVSQRKSMPAIATAVEALCVAFGKPIAVETLRADTARFIEPSLETRDFLNFEDDRRIYAFPTPDAICDATSAELKACGLGYRIPYVLSAAEMVRSGELQLNSARLLPDEALFEELQRVHGVGKKVANCVCLFGFGRSSMVPVDVWIERAITQECAGIDPFAPFGKNAGIIQQYVFYYMTHRK